MMQNSSLHLKTFFKGFFLFLSDERTLIEICSICQVLKNQVSKFILNNVYMCQTDGN